MLHKLHMCLVCLFFTVIEIENVKCYVFMSPTQISDSANCSVQKVFKFSLLVS